MKRIVLIFLFTFTICALFAQDKAEKIFVKGKVKDGKIYLRWATDDMFTLEQGLKHGFIVHRKTILKNNILQDFPLTIELPGSPFLPRPLEQWEAHLHDDNFAIAAQAFYGESFEVGYSTNPFIQAVQREQDRNQRLGFLLFACDQNFAVAEFSALGLVDTRVQRNEKYLYSIFINDTSGQLHIDTGYYFIGLNDVPNVPVMSDVLKAKFSEHQVTLRWDIRFLRNFYSSYVIERSENGRDFRIINDRPFVLLENPGTNPNEMVFVDSLPHLGRTYHYRIRGRDAFGDLSEPSNVVQGRSQRTLEGNPQLTELIIDNGQPERSGARQSQLIIRWDIDRLHERDIAHFEIRSREDRFGEDEVLSSRIAPRRRDVRIRKPARTCYITVIAIGKDGTVRASLPMLFQEEDNEPPEIPEGLVGVIDSNGVVMLQWKANREDDLAGYRVFRANQPTAEFIQITNRSISDTVFFDTVSMNTASSVFYRVLAEDFRGNQSQLSAVCEAKRPVLFAPTAPLIVDYRLEGQRLFLRWANSGGEEVNSTQILIGTDCKSAPTSTNADAGADLQSVPLNWTILGTVGKTGDFDSATFTIRHFGEVKIAAKSVAPGLSSDFSNVLNLSVASAPPVAPELYVNLNREQKTATLRWTIRATEPIERIQILRNEQGEQPIVLRNLSGNETQFLDIHLEEGKIYEYRIRIETESGEINFSRAITLRF